MMLAAGMERICCCDTTAMLALYVDGVVLCGERGRERGNHTAPDEMACRCSYNYDRAIIQPINTYYTTLHYPSTTSLQTRSSCVLSPGDGSSDIHDYGDGSAPRTD
jgi:hypothetical protein